MQPIPLEADPELLQSLATLINGADDVIFAYLFGSRLTKRVRQDSDIDIAVFLKKGCTGFSNQLRLHHLLSIGLDSEVDLLVLNGARNLFLLNEIIQKGVVLVDKLKTERRMFEITTMHHFIDFRDQQKRIYADAY